LIENCKFEIPSRRIVNHRDQELKGLGRDTCFVLITEGLDGQKGGVQRISRAVREVLDANLGSSVIWSANDSVNGERGIGNLELGVGNGERKREILKIRCFVKQYWKMGFAALFGELPKECRKIYCFHLALSPIAAILAWRLSCPFDVFLHGVESWGSLKFLQRWALRKAVGFVANSQYTLDRFRKSHPEFAQYSGNVLALGLNGEFAERPPLTPSYQGGESILEKNARFFLTVSRLEEGYKGMETLLDAFKEFRLNHSDVSLVCVGEGLMKLNLKERCRELQIDHAVQFAGGVSDQILRDYYQQCVGFILLSEGEGFGIVFLEAMFHGKPCIATNVGASQEIVKNGMNGFTVSPQDGSAVVQAMRRLIGEPELAKSMGEEGRRLVEKQYLPEHFKERLRRYFELK
jgi:phosphatidyl-myo-inositol dimannoside synthase